MTEYQAELKTENKYNQKVNVFARNEATARYIVAVSFPNEPLLYLYEASFYVVMEKWSEFMDKNGEGYLQKHAKGLSYVKVDTRGMKLHGLGI